MRFGRAGEGFQQDSAQPGRHHYIDSSGIGELVSAFTTVKTGGAEAANLTKKVHDLLQITKLYTVFDIKVEQRHSAFTK